jgi:tetratricopeptide (TPR) repeat protein
MDFPARTRRVATWTLFALALAYAFVAGLRTVADFDVGWLLATGRYLVTHHQVPRTESFSYTAFGTPWIYPPFGGALLYLIYAAGGFAALSWLNALACLAVVAVAIGRPRLLTCSLAILAIPSIAFRTVPRAEIFTTFFFASYLALLCRHRRGERAWLWLLPPIMLVWVNAHSGFSAGVALLGAYVAHELIEFCFPSRRAEAGLRLKRAGPWIALSLLATALNPWGIGVYRALLAHDKLAAFQHGLVGEWSAVRLTAASFAGALQFRDPNSGYWWLLVFAAVAAVVALCRGRFVDALLVAGAAYVSIEHVRFQALFTIVVIVISAEVFSRPLLPGIKPAARSLVCAAAAMVMAALTLLHIADTVTNRSYLADGELSLFGTGLSWWYPQRAADFIQSNALPQQLFSDYNNSGYLTLRLGPGSKENVSRENGSQENGYRDFADGRGIPFPIEVLTEQATLQQSSPDSPGWKQAADRYGMNTILLSLARMGGLEFIPLQQYCASSDWKPVYLDDVSIVLVRNRPEDQHWIQRFAIDCSHYQIAPPSANPSSARGRAELYNFYANTASIYYVLGRDLDAANAASQAGNLFTDDPSLSLVMGQLLQANGKLAEAETQYRRSVSLRRTDTGWFLLARLLLAQKKYPEAASALKQSADLAVSPATRYQLLGSLDLAMNQPKEALAAFDNADHFGKKLAALPIYSSLQAQVDEGRGRAWLQLNDAKQAVLFLEQAIRLAPNAQRWNLLADAYAAQGRTAEAGTARNRAKEPSGR